MTGDQLELDGGVDGDRACAVDDHRAMKGIDPAVVGRDLADAAPFVERGDATSHPYCTILPIGSSRMPVAPWSFNAGMSTLISLLATTVSTA